MERHVGTLTHPATGHTVTVTAEVGAVAWHPKPITLTYRITTDTGYRASFGACWRDECLAGTITPCSCQREHLMPRDAQRTHRRTHCHGWHDLNAMAFAEAIRKTFDPNRSRGRIGIARGHGEYLPCPTWPIRSHGERCASNGTMPLFADDRERPTSYGFDIHKLQPIRPESTATP